MLKAYSVQENDEGTGGIYYAEHSIVALRHGANEHGDGDISYFKATRAPWADEYAPGPCPQLVMIDHGWWMECHGCGVRIDSDLIEYSDTPDIPDRELKPVEIGHGLWCSAECRERDLKDRQERKDAEDKAKAAIEAMLLEKLPGVTVAGGHHAYVNKVDGVYVPEQVHIAFEFPGSKIGPGHFGHNKIGEEPHVTVCQGDLAAWEAWRESLKQPA